MKQAPPAPRRKKYPPLTAAQQQQVLTYRKIAADHARRLVRGYERLVDGDEAESLAMHTLCRAAQLYNPARAKSGIWPLAKIMIPQRIGEAIHVAMHRASQRDRSGAAFLAKQEAPTASADDRRALRVIIEWASEDPARAETIDRAAVGDDLTPTDLDRLESLREALGLPVVAVVDVATAAQRLQYTRKDLRTALTKGIVPGYRCGAKWRVYLSAALRCVAPGALAPPAAPER